MRLNNRGVQLLYLFLVFGFLRMGMFRTAGAIVATALLVEMIGSRRAIGRWFGLLALVAALPAHAQLPNAVLPIAAGVVTIRVTYTAMDGTPATTTYSFIVKSPPIKMIQPINALNPPRWVDSVVTNKPFCLLQWAKDVNDSTVIIPIGVSTNDPLLAKVFNSSMCPQTTIDPKKMQAIPVPIGPIPP